MDDIKGTVDRIAAHAVTLRAGGAPHQQGMAKDLEDLIQLGKLGPPAGDPNWVPASLLESTRVQLTDVRAQLEAARANNDNLLEVKNSFEDRFNQAVDGARVLEKERDAAVARAAELETELNAAVEGAAHLEKERDALKAVAGAASAAGDTHANLKKRLQAQERSGR